MGFVNERITNREDIEKYDLKRFWDEYYKKEKHSIALRASKGPFEWSIDRDKEMFLIYFGHFLDEEQPDHGRWYINQYLYIFYYESEFYEFILTRLEDKSIFGEKSKLLEYRIKWGIKSIKPNIKMDKKFTKSFKEALTCYSDDGIHNHEWTKYIINFNF